MWRYTPSKSHLMLTGNLALGFHVDHRVRKSARTIYFSKELTGGIAVIVSISFEITEGPTKKVSF